MSHGKEAARDARHGRRGGNWLPDGVDPVKVAEERKKARLCPVCSLPMLLGQKVGHAVCVGAGKAFPWHNPAVEAEAHEAVPDADESDATEPGALW